jgi:hypothetical protein
VAGRDVADGRRSLGQRVGAVDDRGDLPGLDEIPKDSGDWQTAMRRRAIAERAMQPGYDYEDEFEYGLDLILDGLERAWSGRSGGRGGGI